jgi:TPR repeat protein
MTTRRSSLLALVIMCVFSTAVWADFEQATTVYKVGDFKTAFGEFSNLARIGDPRSMYNLGNMHRKGEGTPVDMERAVQLYQSAAERGHALAQNALGIMYATGQGVEPNDIEAYAWFTVSALQGNLEAQKNAERARSLLSESRQASGQIMAREYFENYVGRLKKAE